MRTWACHGWGWPDGLAKRTPGKRRGKARAPKLKARKLKLLDLDPRCKYCGKGLDYLTATVDHIIPRMLGGDDSDENTVLSCGPCNVRKGCKRVEPARPQ